MKFLLILILPVMLFCASEDDNCYTKFSIPDVHGKEKPQTYYHVCIGGYSYVYRRDSSTGSIAIQQNWIAVDSVKQKSVPLTCDCDVMKKQTSK